LLVLAMTNALCRVQVLICVCVCAVEVPSLVLYDGFLYVLKVAAAPSALQ
jgi:hypothetical protein